MQAWQVQPPCGEAVQCGAMSPELSQSTTQQQNLPAAGDLRSASFKAACFTSIGHSLVHLVLKSDAPAEAKWCSHPPGRLQLTSQGSGQGLSASTFNQVLPGKRPGGPQSRVCMA